MSILNTIKAELAVAYDNVTWNKNVSVIIRRLSNKWYDDVYKGEQRKLKGISVLKEAGIWNYLPVDLKA